MRSLILVIVLASSLVAHARLPDKSTGVPQSKVVSAAVPQNKRCLSILESAVYKAASEAASNYWQDMVHTRFVRLVLAPVEPKKETLKFGLLTKEDIEKPADGEWLAKTRYYFTDWLPMKLGHVLAKEKGYRFTPLYPITHYLIDVPTEKIVYELTYARRRPSFLVKTAASIGLWISFWNFVGDHTVQKSQEHGQMYTAQDIVMNEGAYRELIQKDFRYAEILQWQKTGQIRMGETVTPYTEHAAIEQAQAVYLSYESYNRLVDEIGIPQSLEENVAYYSSHPLFGQVANYSVMEIKSERGVHALHPGMISDQQALDLYLLNHAYLTKIRYLEAAFHGQLALFREEQAKGQNASEIHKMVFGPEVVRYLLMKFKDPLEFKNPKQDTEAIYQLRSFIIEYMYWDYIFQTFQAIGVVPLKDDSKPYSADNSMTFEEKRILLLKDFLRRMGEQIVQKP
jgi:hypothetical protein